MKKLFKSYAFWVALASAVAIFLEDISILLGLSINVSIIESLIMSTCGVFVVLGIVKKKDEKDDDSNTNLDTEIDNTDMLGLEKDLVQSKEKEDD